MRAAGLVVSWSQSGLRAIRRAISDELSARARVFSTGQGRKTDAADAHSVAVVALRTRSLRQVRPMTARSRCGCWPTAATSPVLPAR
jgi:hypothetical protein